MGPDDALRGRGKSSREGRRCQGVWKLQGDFMAHVPSLSPTPLPHHAWTGRSQGEEGASQAGEDRTLSTAGADTGSEAVSH